VPLLSIVSICRNAICFYADGDTETRWGLGLDVNDFPSQNVLSFNKVSLPRVAYFTCSVLTFCLKVQYAGGPIYCLAILGFKVSLLAFYLRLADRNNIYRMVIRVVIGLVVVNQLIFTFLLSFACRPVSLLVHTM